MKTEIESEGMISRYWKQNNRKGLFKPSIDSEEEEPKIGFPSLGARLPQDVHCSTVVLKSLVLAKMANSFN